ncbi:MAG: hypothetical protein GY754_24765 [bacterium]|nr:hypothetical protein [bacterium]
MKRLSRLLLMLIVLVIFFSIYAGPTIIRDARISDTALTPVLGRGYTIVTNTFQSKCMDNVVITEPSYDFQYKFESVEHTASASASAGIGAQANVAVPVSGVAVTADYTQKYTFSSGVKEYYHHINAEINMDTYYASVDEARTRLSSSAGELLTNNDIPGFFSSCGSYYVRSLGRNAKFLAVFTYTDISVHSDASFEDKLEMSIKGFAGAGASSSASLKAAAGTKKLTITAQAWGLGKSQEASLISYDIETFKAAIKDAFISMQDPMTGKVTTMEVVPWVENTEFQNMIKLEKDVIDPITGKTMLLYKKKHILNLNAEFFAEIERADRNMMNIYYKGKICRQKIDANWKKDGKFYPAYAKAKVMNNKFPSETMPLAELDKLVDEKELDKMLKVENDFMYGSKGALVCQTKLLEEGLYVKSYREIPECVALRSKLSAVINDNVDNFCMPLLYDEPKPQPTAPVAPAGEKKPTTPTTPATP